MRRLAGKVAIVTGGAGGIGSSTVERFVLEGARVVVADLDADKAQLVADRFKDSAIALFMDGADERSVRTVVEGTVSRFGRLDILHNNHAWILGTKAGDETAVDTSFEVWDKTMSVNLRSYFAGCKYAVPHMIRGGGGSIINMSSDAGIVANFNHIAYNTSKAGVMALTANIATQHGRQGIRCNAISPGLIVTPYVRATAAELVALVAQQRSHKTLERLCSTIADRLLADYELDGVWVKATKPEPPIALSVAEVSVEVWREAEN